MTINEKQIKEISSFLADIVELRCKEITEEILNVLNRTPHEYHEIEIKKLAKKIWRGG